MNKKFWIITIITIVIITATLFPFRQNNNEDEVIFWTLQMSDFSEYINGVINEFEKQNPDIKIKWIDVPFSEGEKRTLASVLSDNPPDLVNLNADFSTTLASKGTLYEISEENTQQYNKEILKSLKFNNKLYSIPWYATSAITIYNKEKFKQLNLPVPKTYNELAKLAPIVKSKTNTYITLPNITENDTMLKILNKYGVNNSENIISDKSIEVFNMYKKLYVNNNLPTETITTTLQESLEKYMSENIILLGAGANFLNMIKENAPQTYTKTDISHQLVGEIGQYDFSLMNFVIPIKAKHKQEALKFALFLTNNKNQLELAKLTNVLAVNQATLNNEFYTKYNDNDLFSKARVISAKQLNKVYPTYVTKKGQKDINNLINNATQEILLNKNNTKTVLQKVAKNWKTIEEENR